jgi:hypothetical protein
MRYAAIAVLMVVIIVVVVWRRRDDAGSIETSRGRLVTRLVNAEERRRVADRIASAHASQQARSSSSSSSSPSSSSSSSSSLPPPRPSLPAETTTDDLARISVPLRDALTEAIPLLAACYAPSERRDDHARARMTLVGDDRGTLIDADDLSDDAGRPLPPALEDCVKTTLRSLELPPLAEGGDLHIEYSFVFR